MTAHFLTDYLERSAAAAPESLAIVDSGGASLTYGALDRGASAVAAALRDCGIGRGDRVGLAAPKTTRAVMALFGILKAGAAYVPVDSAAPVERARRIMADCGVQAVVATAGTLSFVPDTSRLVILLDEAGPRGAGAESSLPHAPQVLTLDAVVASGRSAPTVDDRSIDDLAYILYTSGSTGVPKGVMLSHLNATSFVDWCSDTFEPTSRDRFSSHAPLHFDLSVLDLFVPIKHGASVFLIGEALARSPRELARFIASNRLTVWYSAPSILTMLAQLGRLETQDCSSLRLVLFAGEVFPVKHLRAVQSLWPHPGYFNLYGPTETNVCTFAAIPGTVPADRDVPYPIGPACAHCLTLVLDAAGHEVSPGAEGLLYVAGPSVFAGYWNRPAENARAFIERDGRRWYNTGDLVRWTPGEGFIYLGRRDRMVKRRGYRIELGEIERALLTHPDVREAAVIAREDADAGVRIVAFVAGTAVPGPIELKQHCARYLPVYMSPDDVHRLDALPRTSTDKIDYQGLSTRLVLPQAV